MKIIEWEKAESDEEIEKSDKEIESPDMTVDLLVVTDESTSCSPKRRCGKQLSFDYPPSIHLQM